ncbi:winged helix-turn-helix domain-containing protein [Variovorax sp. Root318D1]|uniref:winged helix-turn-helix domain-containing protein n=1 Tax=Variovorax sp. Root318D1 TaxID=1736513 RepID=UPI0009EC1C24|nr:winged helix-turn-helix domain-containing protein [Variovorax sp. Root318D1]
MSASKQPPHQRVGVLDPVFRTREHMRRTIRAFGHAPLIFEDLQELLFLPTASLRCSAMCIGLPRRRADLATWISGARNAVGPNVPLLFLTRENLLKPLESLGCNEIDLLVAAPSSFSDVYVGLEGCMARHALAPTGPGLEWGGYRFKPSTKSVMVDEEEIRLSPLEFELALEFFHNVGQVLSRQYLLTMASSLAPSESGRWLNACIARLRDKLNLGVSRGCEWRLVHIRGQGYRLSRSSPPAAKSVRMRGAAG